MSEGLKTAVLVICGSVLLGMQIGHEVGQRWGMPWAIPLVCGGIGWCLGVAWMEWRWIQLTGGPAPKGTWRRGFVQAWRGWFRRER